MTRRAGVRSWVASLVVLASAVALLVALPATVRPDSTANAADAANWNAGYIIDDRLFYDSSSMDSSAIQSFLNRQVTNCRSGYTCVKDYRQDTDNRPADRYCNGYTARSNESAAQIIDRVSRSCGISQQVLIVLLQKEQGLITDSAPSSWSYSAAMGQGCPDTAPCNPATMGFFYQAYYGARQYQIYRQHPTSFGYQAGRWNNILYHPDPSRNCGSARVFIENQATAALYIYTPYTPNAAALRNMYGTGDGCSSYGNRNFWRLFTDWFGNPHRYETHPGFDWYWQARGAGSGVMGQPASNLIYAPENGGGYYQKFDGGTLYTSNLGATAFVFNNEFGRKYAANGGPSGPLGWPKAEQMCATDGACVQTFLQGTITAAASAGANIIWGGIADYWSQSGGLYGPLGAALEDSRLITAHGIQGWQQRFARGTYSTSTNGTYVIPAGAVNNLWVRSYAAEGGYGWPASAYRCVGGSCAQSFQVGTLSSTDTWGAHAIVYGFESAWRERGGLDRMGAALDDLRYGSASGGGWIQQFASSAIVQSPTATTTMPYDSIYGYWQRGGMERSWLGWPSTSRECSGSACAVTFQGGILTSSGNSAPLALLGGFVDGWKANGGIATVGAATTSLRYSTSNGGGWIQDFGGGTITQTSTGVPIFLPKSAILSTWYYYGGEATWLGWPTAAPSCDANGCTQQFQFGVGRSNTSGAVTFSRT